MVYFRDVIDMAIRVRNDFDDERIEHLHPAYINTRKRKTCNEVENVVKEFWEKDATIPEPSYRKVNQALF